MQNKKGNVAVIATIIVIVAITVSVITWLVANKIQAPAQQTITQSTTPASVAQAPTQSVATQSAPTTASVNEAANWKLYTNDKYKVSFKYPADLSIKDQNELIDKKSKFDDRLVYITLEGYSEKYNIQSMAMTITNNDNTAFNEADYRTGNKFAEKDLNIPDGKFIVNDSYSDANGNYFFSATFIGNDYIYVFDLNSEKYQKDAVDLFEKILLTAKFTK